jgi:hypothetical protein
MSRAITRNSVGEMSLPGWNGTVVAAVRVTVLAVGAALSNFDEPEAFQNPGDLTGFEDRNVAHSMRP